MISILFKSATLTLQYLFTLQGRNSRRRAQGVPHAFLILKLRCNAGALDNDLAVATMGSANAKVNASLR
jgi:hypothetical protein